MLAETAAEGDAAVSVTKNIKVLPLLFCISVNNNYLCKQNVKHNKKITYDSLFQNPIEERDSHTG